MTAKSRNDQSSAGSTTRQAANSAHEFIDAAASKAEKAEKEVRARAEAVGHKAEATQELASKKAEKVLSQTEVFVREQPIAAAGLAFAAGVVASALLRR
jgi:ElaB/YqjD/DUF883 family membrane-anchored ribosome-binding protein